MRLLSHNLQFPYILSGSLHFTVCDVIIAPSIALTAANQLH